MKAKAAFALLAVLAATSGAGSGVAAATNPYLWKYRPVMIFARMPPMYISPARKRHSRLRGLRFRSGMSLLCMSSATPSRSNSGLHPVPMLARSERSTAFQATDSTRSWSAKTAG